METKIKDLVIPHSVETIGEGAFQDSPIEKLTLNEGITTIGDCAFFRTKIEDLVIPHSVETLSLIHI